MTLRDQINAERQRQQMTVSELARRCQWPRSYVTRYLRAHRDITGAGVERLLLALRIKLKPTRRVKKEKQP